MTWAHKVIVELWKAAMYKIPPQAVKFKEFSLHFF